jgi:predicted  nucleic acid-binding Zn-ribbon protein
VESTEILQWLVTLARGFEEQAGARTTVERASRLQGIDAELVEEYAQDLANLKSQESDLGQAIRAKEKTIQDIEAKIARKRQQLDQIRDNKEYKALTDEIQAQADMIDATETEMLQDLERIEAHQKQIMTLESEIASKRAEITARTAELKAAAETAAARLEKVEKEISTCYEQLPPELVMSIERLQQKVSLPVAWLDGEACGGCHAHFPTQIAIEISRGRSVVRCQTCGRYVVAHD